MAADIPALTYRNLELSLDRAGNGLFRVRLRGLSMDRTPPPISLDLDGLADLRHDTGQYGRRLGELLFAAPGLADAFGQARGSVYTVPGYSLRLRLVIPPDVSELHRLAWETLVVPGDDMPLAMDERVLFSRCLGSQEMATATTHNANPKIVAAIANPTDISDRIDVAGELDRLQSNLGDLTITALVDGHATLEYIGQVLAEGSDVLYLACHGLIDQDTPLLVLEDRDRKTALASGKELAAAIRRLPRKPSLVVLASCQSAGAGEGEVLAATGPLLVDAGVPAVVAMQGSVRMDTMAQWLPAFWRAWRKDGAVDRAAAAARWAVREQDDWWMPVAFVRLPAEQPALRRRRADFYKQIDPPPHYVPRPELLAEIKQTLLTEHDAGKPVALTSAVRAHVDALHGMGGIGKTVAARVLCDDTDVQAAYTDGILWATVGQTPDLIPQLRDWIRELGGIVSENAPTVASLKNLLAELLVERACLLVVDDVWSVEDAQVFLVPAPGCRVVMTTRDAAVAEEIGAAVQPIPLMALDEAVELLRAWAGGGLAGVADEQVVPVVERLGRLPLAIKLAGPQFVEVELATWLQEFDLRDLEARRGDGLHRSLEVAFGLSIDRLSEQHRHLYAALTIFPEGEQIPPVAIEKLWSELGGLTVRQVRRLLHDLADQALVQMAAAGDGEDAAISLHDLLRDLMAIELGETGKLAAHGALLAAYRRTQAGRGWHTAPDDGYLYGHLAYHLEELATSDPDMAIELERLFADDEWMRVRVPADDYQYDGFLADLDRMWQFAHIATLNPIASFANELPFPKSVHSALIHASVCSLARNYRPELVGRLIETGLWSTSRALSIAARIPDETKRSRVFAEIMATGRCNALELRFCAELAVESLLSIRQKSDRAEVIGLLVPYLENPIKDELVRLWIEAIADSLEYPRFTYLDDFVLMCPEDMTLVALEGVSAIESESIRSEFLVAMAPLLKDRLLKTAIATANSIDDQWLRAQALVALVSSLEAGDKAEVLEELVSIAMTSEDMARQVDLLTDIAVQLDGAQKENILAVSLSAAYSITDARPKIEALAKMIPLLRGRVRNSVLRETLTSAFTHWEQPIRFLYLPQLLPYLKGDLRKEALHHAINEPFYHPDQFFRFRFLVLLLDQVKGQAKELVLETALRIARGYDTSSASVSACADLARQLHGRVRQELLDEALGIALIIDDREGQVSVLTKLLPMLQGELRDRAIRQALLATTQIDYEPSPRNVIRTLASYLDIEMLQQWLHLSRAFRDQESQVSVLCSLAQHVAVEHRSTILATALVSANTIAYGLDRSHALIALSLLLDREAKETVLEQILDTATTELAGFSGILILEKLLPHLEGERKVRAQQAAFAMATSIGTDEVGGHLLAELVPYLDGELRQQSIQISLMRADYVLFPDSKANLYITLAPFLKGKNRDKALRSAISATQDVKDERRRASLLARLAPLLDGKLLQVGLKTRCSFSQETWRDIVDAAFARKIGEDPLGAALRIKLEYDRVDALVKIAPTLSRDMQQQVLDAIESIQDSQHRSRILEALSPNLARNLLKRSIVLAQEIPEVRYRARAIAALSPNLDDDRLIGSVRRQIATDLYTAFRLSSRSDLLTYLATPGRLAPPLFTPDEVAAVTEAIIDVTTKWRWL